MIIKYLKLVIGTALVISYVLAIYEVIMTDILPTWQLLLCIAISLAIVAALLVFSFKKKLSFAWSAAVIILSALAIAASLYTYSVFNSTRELICNIQEVDYSYIEYSVIAKKSKTTEELGSSGQKMGIIDTDSNIDILKTEIDKKFEVKYVNSSNITEITVDLDSGNISLATINSSYLLLLSENYNEFYSSIKVIDTITIKVKKEISASKADITKPFIIYVSGVDTYGNISTVSRSDVNILAVINPMTHKILLVTTPRDYYVQLHGTTGLKDKLTHAGIYGIDMSVKTMQDLYDINIDYYLRVNFSSLMNIVDAIGGVDVDSAYSFTAGGYSFSVGKNSLDGKKALAFSRERHSFEAGDRTRGENQQRVIEAIISKMNNPSTLLNYRNIVSSVENVIETNLSTDSINLLIKNQLNDMSKWSVESISVTGVGSHNSTYSMGSMQLYVMEPDIESLDNAKVKIGQYQQ
jgi:LCP family protein required for cell wall assembly